MSDVTQDMTRTQKLVAVAKAVNARRKRESDQQVAIAVIDGVVAGHERAIRSHPPSVVAVYEGTQHEIKAGLPSTWVTESGDALSLGDHDIEIIRQFLVCSSFISTGITWQECRSRDEQMPARRWSRHSAPRRTKCSAPTSRRSGYGERRLVSLMRGPHSGFMARSRKCRWWIVAALALASVLIWMS